MEPLKVFEISLIFGLLVVGGTYSFSYQGYKVYEVTPESYEDAEFLQKFNDDKFDFWKESRTLGDPSDIMVAPEDQSYFERELTKYGLKYKIAVDDVERILQQENIERSLTRSSLGLGSVTFTNYMFYGENYHIVYMEGCRKYISKRISVNGVNGELDASYMTDFDASIVTNSYDDMDEVYFT